MGWLLTTISFFSLVSLSAVNALACSCASRLPCQAYGEASAVFVGTVRDIRITTATHSNYGRSKRVVRLSVDSAFRGIKGSEVDVTTGMGGGDCGFEFVPAEQYLVYAYENEGRLSTGICSRTRSISKAAEDLNYLRGLASAKPGATITGKVIKNSRNKNGEYEKQLLAHIKIAIKGPTKREIETDNKGQFRVEGLPAGLYSVKVSLPEGLAVTGPFEQEVTVTDRGCGVVEFWFEPAARTSNPVADRRW